MSTIHRSRLAVSAFAGVLMFTLCAPIVVTAEDQVLVEEQVVTAEDQGPVAKDLVSVEEPVIAVAEQVPALAPASAASWDETSGYGAVEASRAGASALLAPVAGPTWDETSGYGAVEASRATNAQHALQSHDLGSMQEDALAAIVAAAPSWDETSGYGSVEAARATIGHPAVGTTSQASRVLAAQHAMLSGDIGSKQEERLSAIVAAAPSWDETSGYGAVEASRAETVEYGVPVVGTPDAAALLAQFRAVELSLSRDLGVDQQLPSGAGER